MLLWLYAIPLALFPLLPMAALATDLGTLLTAAPAAPEKMLGAGACARLQKPVGSTGRLDPCAILDILCPSLFRAPWFRFSEKDSTPLDALSLPTLSIRKVV